MANPFRLNNMQIDGTGTFSFWCWLWMSYSLLEWFSVISLILNFSGFLLIKAGLNRLKLIKATGWHKFNLSRLFSNPDSNPSLPDKNCPSRPDFFLAYKVKIALSNRSIIEHYVVYPSRYVLLTLARKRCFATFAGVGGLGVGATPPWRFQTKRRRASRKRPADCARRVLAIGGIIFGPRSIFDPVMAGQSQIFGNSVIF